MIVCKKLHKELLKQSIIQITMKVDLSTKKKTHYETLGVSPNATHNEIKSAYYKLTFKYHPDKNRSESAKQIFQEVSNAYNVVGNYQSRKQYDRTIAVRQDIRKVIHKPVYRQPDISNVSDKKIYDFDEWTRQHYQRTFSNDMKKKWAKESKEFYKHAESFQKREEPSRGVILALFALFAISFVVIIRSENYDTPVREKKK